jgi:hypothetical protein
VDVKIMPRTYTEAKGKIKMRRTGTFRPGRVV